MKRLFGTLLIIPFLLGCKEKEYTGLKLVVEKDDSGLLADADPTVMYEVAVTNKKDCVFYIGDEGCSACKKLKPQLEAWVKAYKGRIYYIQLSSITSENFHYLIDATVGYYEYKEGDSVPATYFFTYGEVAFKGTSDDTMSFLTKYVTVEE